MKTTIRSLLLCASSVLLPGVAAAQPAAGPPPITAVLATLTVKPGIDRAALLKTMPDEVRETVKLYLDGKIQQWFARGDGRGVVFIMNAPSIDAAKAVTDTLPLIKADLASFEFMTLGPLTPLRFLLSPAPVPARDDDRRR